jgi:DUF971 family protein
MGQQYGAGYVDSFPAELQIVEPSELLIRWSDGQRRVYTFSELRSKCPCATCREKHAAESGQPQAALPVLKPVEAQPLKITAMKPIGSYAYSIHFSDGHNTGIYTFEYLRELGRDAGR